MSNISVQAQRFMTYELPDLPYSYTALEPYISKSTLEFHHDKHHAAYVNKFNAAVAGTDLADKPLEDAIKTTSKDSSQTSIFNNAAQAWNHTFYWNSMKPDGGGQPTGRLAEKIQSDFGSFEQFTEAFKTAGSTQFGSGWAWLVLDNGTLKVTKTLNAENPLSSNQVPLMTMDVWEHAYYLDYQNKRPDYITAFLEHLVNWDFASENLMAT